MLAGLLLPDGFLSGAGACIPSELPADKGCARIRHNHQQRLLLAAFAA
jgi:hypothetical protein